MSPSTLALSQRILARLMPPAQAEALLGDLLEERRLRLQAGSHVSVAGWYWRQLASSVPVLLWASVRRGAWLITVVTAVASYIAAVGIQLVLRSALSPMTTSSLCGPSSCFSPSPPHWPPAGTSPRQSVSGRRDCSSFPVYCP
jgi:hypothetical protein